MLKSRETLIQDAKNAIKEPKQLAMVLDLIDSAWQWRTGGAQEATRERWVTVGGQTKKGSTTDEAGPKTQDGGQTLIPVVGTAGPQGERGPAGATGPAGADGKDGAGSVTSVGLSLGAAMDAIANVSSSPVVTSGNIGLELADQPSGKALMSPVSGTGKPSFRAITIDEVQALAGRLPILITRFMETSEAPPSSPSIGDVYALSFGMTGVFAGHDNDIATWNGITWSFVAPIYKQLAYNISAYSSASTQGGLYYWGGSFPFWVNLQYKDLQSYAINAQNSLTIGDFSAFEYSHPNSAAVTQSILVFDRAGIQTTGIAFKTAGTNKYASISGSDANERELNLRGFSTGAPLDEGVWTSLRLLDIKAVNGVFTGASPIERINSSGDGFLRTIKISGGIGAFGVDPPASRPNVSVACSDLATCISLLNELRAALIGCGIVQ